MSLPSRNPLEESFETALAAIELGYATIEQLRLANEWRQRQRPPIGKLAMNYGKLTIRQVFAILGEQALTGELFGKIALQMGLISVGDLYTLLAKQVELTPTLADSLIAHCAISQEQASVLIKRATFDKPLLEDLHLVESIDA